MNRPMGSRNDFENMCAGLDDPKQDPIKRARGYIENYCHGDHDRILQLQAEAGEDDIMAYSGNMLALIALLVSVGAMMVSTNFFSQGTGMILVLVVLAAAFLLFLKILAYRHVTKWRKYVRVVLEDYRKMYESEQGLTEAQQEQLRSAGETAAAEIEKRRIAREQYELECAEREKKVIAYAQETGKKAEAAGKAAAKKAAIVGKELSEKAATTGKELSEKAAITRRELSEKAAITGKELSEKAAITRRELSEKTVTTREEISEKAAAVGEALTR